MNNQPNALSYLSGMPYIRKSTTFGNDGSRMVRTAKVINGVESDVQYQYTPGIPLPLNLLPFTQGNSHESTAIT